MNSANDAGFTAYAHGSPQTFNLVPAEGSALIDVASSVYAPATDNDGTSRPTGLYDDIGAIESPNYKYLCAFTIASGDSSSGFIAAGLEGTTAVASCTFEYQDKVSGGTFADAGSTQVSGGSFGFSYETRYPVELLPDSLYVRGRITAGTNTGPWHEEVVYRERQPHYIVYVFAADGTTGITAAGDSVRIDYGPEAGFNAHKTYHGARVAWIKPTMYRGAFSCVADNMELTTFCGANTLDMVFNAGAPFDADNPDAAGLLYFGAAVKDSLAGGTVSEADLYVFYGATVPAGTAYYVACTAAGMYQWATGNADVSYTNAKQSTATAWATALASYANWSGLGPSSSVAGYAGASNRTCVTFTTPSQSWDGAASYAGVVLVGGTNATDDAANMSHFGDSDADRRPILAVKVAK
jgi:hypothetical protein